MTWLLRLLLFVVLFLLARSIVSRFLGSRTRSNFGRARGPASSDSVPKSVGSAVIKDPQCGMYIDRGLALPFQVDGKTLFFCSEECRRLYEARTERVH